MRLQLIPCTVISNGDISICCTTLFISNEINLNLCLKSFQVLDPKMRRSTEFPGWVEDNKHLLEGKKVVYKSE